ncbi:neurotrophin 1-like [Tachypleus tridentatus]|uniref:neurotrophin 1-like n=1 Tax=Tachypleus tridentatus TaxID=6853 RepID=UPI003FD2725D
MYVEVPDNMEELRNNKPFSYFYNFTRQDKGRRSRQPWSWASDLYHKESLCKSIHRMIQPGLARDTSGKWFIVVQTKQYPQRIPTELCRSPGNICKNMADCGKNSRCIQRYSYQLLITFDLNLSEKCPFMKLFKFPSSCVCHVQADKTKSQ